MFAVRLWLALAALAVDPFTLAVANCPLASQITTAILAASTQFGTNYTADSEPTLSITGWKPDGDGPYPVVIFLGASSLAHAQNVGFLNFLGSSWEYGGEQLLPAARGRLHIANQPADRSGQSTDPTLLPLRPFQLIQQDHGHVRYSRRRRGLP
jgi:hypothetical protein